jgi:hypothetical protein
MKNVRLREFAKLAYGDPRGFLAELRNFEGAVAASPMPDRIKTLRTQRLKSGREMRDAAIFCVGISERFGYDVRFAPVEDQDFDFIVTWVDGDATRHFCPVQLKEVVPPHLNANATIQDLVNSLTRYVDSADLIVAIKISRSGRFDPATLQLPANLCIGGLWIFASISADQSEFGLWGDFLNNTEPPKGTRFSYPLSIQPATPIKNATVIMKKRTRDAAKGKTVSPSQLIDARIAALGDWRGEMLGRIRALIKEADPDIVEEVKWRKPSNPMGVPVWEHDGIVCTGETYKAAVKMTFANGASLEDPSDLFNASLDGNTRRAIDFHEGDKIDERALKALIRAAVALNKSKAKR